MNRPDQTSATVFFLVVALFLCVAGCEKLTGHEEITAEVIESSLVDRHISEGFGKQWRFAPEEHREFIIVNTRTSGDVAVIYIDIKTNDIGLRSTACHGRIRLEYEWISTEWQLYKLDSVGFACK